MPRNQEELGTPRDFDMPELVLQCVARGRLPVFGVSPGGQEMVGAFGGELY